MITLLCDDTMISAMARELRGLRSFDIRGVAKFAAVLAGFSPSDIARFLDRAIEYERCRRKAFACASSSLV
jgi:hypothetical protein